MTFLNPLFLLGLAAAAIPLLIHLLNLRRLKTIDFSSLRFLKELQKTTIRRLKVRQILLLILRTLLILFLVLAFARPALRGSFANLPGSTASTTAVLLLDDSPSMDNRNEQGVLIDQVRTQASSILDLMDADDRVAVVPLSSLLLSPKDPVAVPPGTAKAQIQALRPSQVRVTYSDALARIVPLLEETRNANREIYLLTDGQATQFRQGTPARDSLVQLPADTRAFVVRLNPGNLNNTGLATLKRGNQIIARNRPCTFQAAIRNYGEQAVRGGSASLYLDGVRVAQQSYDLEPGGTRNVPLTAVPRRRGILQGYVRLEDDALAGDNNYYVVLPVPQDIRVLIAGPTPAHRRYARLALQLGADSAGGRIFTVQEIAEEHLTGADLRMADVLILCGIRDFTPQESDRISSFVREGRGLIVFPGRESQTANYNSTLLARLSIPAIQAPAAVPPSSEPSASFLSFSTVDRDHPIFTGVFEQRAGQVSGPRSMESPRITSALTIRPGPRDRTIITMTDGRPFLTEFSSGGGRILMCAVDAGMEWSDFPVRGVFVPLLHRSVHYLASSPEPAEEHTTGRALTMQIRLRDTRQEQRFVLQSPGGINFRVVPQGVPGAGTARVDLPAAEETGVYTLWEGNAPPPRSDATPVQAVAVNLPAAESDLRPAGEEELTAFWRNHGVSPERVRILSERPALAAAVGESRYGVELRTLFLVLALLCALAEMAVGRERREDA